MTLNDLRDEVAALAFEDGITLDKSFIASANRALITLFTERPAAKCVRIITHEQKPILHIPHMTHAASKDITINLSGIAYAFRVSGKGSFRVEDGISVTLKDFDTESSLFRGKLRNSDAKITFGGNFLYNVYSLVCYSDLYSDDEGDIREYEEYSKYDLDRLFGDFLTFLEPPTANGTVVTDAIMQNGTLLLPWGKYDQVTLNYARMPKRISADTPNEKIDISGECVPLLALLTASYLWLDDDAEKAQYYMSLYRTQMSFIRRYNTSMSTSEYRDVTGWA